MPYKITKPHRPWKSIDHLATPSNITKFEFACCQKSIYRKHFTKIKPSAEKNGPVKWIKKEGKDLN
jgi:hypothetical protein